MNVLIADSKAGVYVADQQGKVKERVACGFPSPYRPCASPEHLVVADRISRDALCLHRDGRDSRLLLPSLPALGCVCLSPCGRYLYQLSTEADCIHTLHLGSGELYWAMPAGVFPRSMQLSPDGRFLLAGGGAVCEACLFSAPELEPVRTIHTRHPCFAAAFSRRCPFPRTHCFLLTTYESRRSYERRQLCFLRRFRPFPSERPCG